MYHKSAATHSAASRTTTPMSPRHSSFKPPGALFAGPNLMAHEHRRVGPLAFSTLQLRYSSTICDAEWLAVHSDTGFVSSVVTFSAMSSIGRVALRTIEASSSKSFGPKPLGSTCLSAFHGPLASEKRLRPLRVDHDARGVFEPTLAQWSRSRPSKTLEAECFHRRAPPTLCEEPASRNEIPFAMPFAAMLSVTTRKASGVCQQLRTSTLVLSTLSTVRLASTPGGSEWGAQG